MLMNKKLLFLLLCCIFAGGSISNAFAQPSKSVALNASYAANDKQCKELMHDHGLTEEQARMIQQFSWERTQQINALNKLKLPKQELRAKRDAVTDEYYRKIGNILTPEQHSKFNPGALKAAKADEIKQLKLPREQAYKMGELKASYDAQIKALTEQELPARKRKSQKEMLDKDYHAKLKALLGDAKFAQWLNFKNTALERKYKAKYGFTTAQFNKYKAIENKKAIDMLAIKKSAIPAEEKAAKMQAVKAAKIESMRTLLSAEQFKKWFEDDLKKEQQYQQQRVANHK